MEVIFPKLKETNYDESFIDIWGKARRIATPVYFESYFRLDFPEDEIKKSEIEKFKKLEHMYIPENIDYDEIKGISNIARAGLDEVRPLSIGEATRISGVTSNDITLIIAHMNIK